MRFTKFGARVAKSESAQSLYKRIKKDNFTAMLYDNAERCVYLRGYPCTPDSIGIRVFVQCKWDNAQIKIGTDAMISLRENYISLSIKDR